jgi:hypothetical protein
MPVFQRAVSPQNEEAGKAGILSEREHRYPRGVTGSPGGLRLHMTTADDHWPTTLERVMGAVDFELTPGPKRDVRAKARGEVSQLPALVGLAVQAAIQVDKRVADSDTEAPVDRKAILARKDMARAMADGVASMFVTGYATAYRLELARILWAGISDAPRRRLEELARPRPASS